MQPLIENIQNYVSNEELVKNSRFSVLAELDNAELTEAVKNKLNKTQKETYGKETLTRCLDKKFFESALVLISDWHIPYEAYSSINPIGYWKRLSYPKNLKLWVLRRLHNHKSKDLSLVNFSIDAESDVDVIKNLIEETTMNNNEIANDVNFILHILKNCKLDSEQKKLKYLEELWEYAPIDYFLQEDSSGECSMHIIARQMARNEIAISILEKHSNFAEKLLSHVNKNNETPIKIAIKSNNTKLVKYIIEKFPKNRRIMDDCNESLLHFSVKENRAEILKILLDNDQTDVEKQNHEKNNFLHLAVENAKKDPNCVKVILSNVANEKLMSLLNSQNNKKLTPLFLALKNNDIDLIKNILTHDSGSLNYEFKDENGLTVLHYSIDCGDIGIVQNLLWNSKGIVTRSF